MRTTRIITHAPHLGPKPPRASGEPPLPVVEESAPLYEPSLLELAGNFAEAMARVAVAGLGGQRVKVTEEEYHARAAACDGCEFWDAAALFGRCRVPGCGCTRFKRWLAPELCRHPAGSRWPEIEL